MALEGPLRSELMIVSLVTSKISASCSWVSPNDVRIALNSLPVMYFGPNTEGKPPLQASLSQGNRKPAKQEPSGECKPNIQGERKPNIHFSRPLLPACVHVLASSAADPAVVVLRDFFRRPQP